MNQQSLWIGTSWKMNKTLAEGLAFARVLVEADNTSDPRIQRFVVPPFTCVREVKVALGGTSVKVGAQNMHWADAGAWTGEISAPMLVDCGLDLVELGHSERRAHFGETDETVGLKVAAAHRHGLIPLICIGETLEEREAGRATDVLAAQVSGALGQVSGGAPVLLAYEPVWAIGDRGIPATSDYADARQAEIIAVAAEVLGRRVPCLYGGSVNPDNCEELIRCPHVDGLFIGRSAWDAEGYLNILGKCAAILELGELT
jgi:triosephosphate isomerase